MSRALLSGVIQDQHGNVRAGVTVHVYEPGTTTPIVAGMHTTLSGGAVLTNPLTTDANGGFTAFLDAAQDVDLLVVDGSVSRTVPAVAGGSGGGNTAGQAVYGDASAGDVTISVDTELTTTLYANDLTIDAGKTLNCSGWPIYVRGTLTNNGIITGSPLVDLAGNDGAGGGAGTNPTSFYLYEAAGADGGQPGNNGAVINSSYRGGLGGRWAGNGGDAGAFLGGVANGATGSSALQRSSFGGGIITANATKMAYIGGQGGGGGAGDTSTGGGGASSGSVVVVIARHIVNSGTISAPGGVGGAGDSAGRAGGGGGGQGGLIILIYDTFSGTFPTLSDVPGGAGGLGAGGGSNGQAGEAGLVLDIANA